MPAVNPQAPLAVRGPSLTHKRANSSKSCSGEMSYQRVCICGTRLKAQKRGRRPLYCGQKCRRRVEFARRRLPFMRHWAAETARYAERAEREGKPWAGEERAYADEVAAELAALEEIGVRK